MFPPSPPAARVFLLEEEGPLRELLAAGEGDFTIVGQTGEAEEAIASLTGPEAPEVLVARVPPDESGAYLVARLRAAAPAAAIVACTAGEVRFDPLAAGADEWLSEFPPQAAILRMAVRGAAEKRRLMQAWQRDRDMLAALLEASPERIYFKDRMSRFVRVSRAMAEGARKSEAELLGRSDFDLFLADHAQEAFQDEQQIVKTGQAMPAKLEKEMRTDGRVDWVETRKFPFRDSQGNIQGTFGISRHITRLKKMEEELERERNLLSSVLRNLPDSIFAKNADGVYILSNQAHATALGQQGPDDVIGRTVFDFFTAEAAHRFASTDRKIMETREAIVNLEEEAIWADGNHRWLLTTKVPLYNNEGEGILVCIGRDITQRKGAEMKLMEVNANLFAATADLKNANEELRDLQLQVIEAEKHQSVARLAAGVAHEVKNPLAIISMGAEYLLGVETADPASLEVAQQIREAALRADGVVKGLLDFSVPRQVALELCDLNEIVRRGVALLQGEFTRAEVKVSLALGELPEVRLDRTKIGQIVVNILMNAVQAMDGPGTLDISTRVEQITAVRSPDGRERTSAFLAGEMAAILRVEDSGPGIAETHLSKIFDPFFTTKPTGKGTGLGMTVVKSIVDLHHGAIEIKNRPEGGVAVTIAFKTNL